VTLDEAVDHLYAADLDAFVGERARLARELRDSGDRSAAEQVGKLKKPTVAAWALNQLARRRRRDVDLLLDAGHRLRQAQEGVVGGADRASFEKAQQNERDALRRLTQQASELLGGASAQVLSQISQTLRAAAVSEEGRELLARGRFTTPLEAEGFDVFGVLPAPPKAGPTKKQPAQAQKKASDELRKAKERLRELEQQARAAKREAERSKSEWRKNERAAEAARTAVAAAQRELTQAQRRARK
jgi:hypothetical protein